MIERFTAADGYSFSRIIKGGWHLAGDHGAVDARQAIADMLSFVEAGITTFDCADIYTGVERLIGDFRRVHPSAAARLQIHTKFVPDLSDLPSVDRHYVERIIDRSLQRLGVQRLDLVQFHWWDFGVPGYIDAALQLQRLQQAGKIAHLGVTNFDTAHLTELVSAGVPVRYHQLQYSVIDARPAGPMEDFCAAQDINLLCYGTVCGGFLSERWLGQPEPRARLTNRSLVKYKLIIDDFGGWELFQQLLALLASIAAHHGTDIASVATRLILDRPQVAAAIVGATNISHLPAHEQIAALRLEPQELASIRSITDQRQGPTQDVYVLERDRTGRHGRIMRYELNRGPTESGPQ